MSKQPRRPVRFLFLLALAAAIVLAILYARCGLGGLGLGGGKGDSKGDDRSQTQKLAGGDAGAGPAAKPPCKLRLDGTGVLVDGKVTTVAGAVDSCKKAGGAEMTVTGDASFGIRQELRDELRAADVPVLER